MGMVKRRLELFSFYDRTGLESHLARMAKRGWLLEKCGTLWTYRRCEPKALTFSVCYFPKASQFDPGPSEEQETFYDFCRHTGWTLAASAAQMQIFYNEREDPVPIETDPVLEVEAVHRSVKRSLLPSQLMMILLGLVELGLMASQLRRDPVEFLSGTSSLFSVLCWGLVLLLAAVEIGRYCLWHRGAVRAAARGEFPATRSGRRLQLLCLGILLAGLLWYALSVLASGDRMMISLLAVMFCVYVPLVVLLVNGTRTLLKRRGASAKVNRAVTLTVSLAVSLLALAGITVGTIAASSRGWFAGSGEETYTYRGNTFTAHHDPLPLSVEDLLGVRYDGCDRERRVRESPLLAREEIRQRPRFDVEEEIPALEYTIVRVKVPALYGLCEDSLLHARDYWNTDEPEEERWEYRPVDPAPWGAERAYQWGRSAGPLYDQYLLCYGDRIVEIDFDWPPTMAQMALTGERLGSPGAAAGPDA